MEWLGAVELTGGVLVLLLVLPIAGLFLRRRWLSNKAAVFDCALHLRENGPGLGWATGVARYDGDVLQWYRTFSLSTRPRLSLRRDLTQSIGRRPPTPAESAMMFDDDEILRVESRQGHTPRVWEMAMNPQSLTGLMSWLEAAPPGGDSYRGLGLAEPE